MPFLGWAPFQLGDHPTCLFSLTPPPAVRTAAPSSDLPLNLSWQGGVMSSNPLGLDCFWTFVPRMPMYPWWFTYPHDMTCIHDIFST